MPRGAREQRGLQPSVLPKEEEIGAQFEANALGLFGLTRAILPVVRERKGGHVINITSIAGFIGFPATSAAIELYRWLKPICWVN